MSQNGYEKVVGMMARESRTVLTRVTTLGRSYSLRTRCVLLCLQFSEMLTQTEELLYPPSSPSWRPSSIGGITVSTHVYIWPPTRMAPGADGCVHVGTD